MAAENYEGQWPIAKFHFRVDIDGEDISFQEVSGLEMETSVIEYRHGDSENFYPTKTAGLVKTSNLVCKKGVFADDSELVELFNKIFDEKAYYDSEDSRFDILVELLDEEGEAVMTWNIINAFPIKFSGTDLKSDANEIAIESVEFAYEFIEMEMA
ncbi:MAG: phage tail protein [Saprospiraceae bacterium]